jgi:acyl-CoA synthetase (AMP-forming)/AMP-acid ligase II
MHPGIHAAKNPDKPALVMAGSGETLAYGELDRRSNRLARLWWDAGLRRGDRVAVFMENHPRYFEVVWAALRSGLYLTAVNSHLQPAEAAYILNDCGARSLVSSRALARVVEGFARDIPRVEVRLMVDAAAAGFASYEREVERFPAEPLEEEPLGDFMLYSSGTTGRPKGVRRPLSGRTAAEGLPLVPLLAHLFGLDASSVYLSPAPLYHAAPLGFTTATQALGGTVVVLERFDAEAALAAIARYRVTHSQWVPTMFQRLLRLPEETKRKYDLSSHRVAIHAAAPCPVHLKERMMEWWGPILHEYYGATEGHGLTCVGPEEWLRHKGTVGKPVVGTLHIVDEQGRECPPGAVGTVYFESPVRFEYHGDPAKTKAAYHERGWSTVGDVGYVDEEGYLYLTDRKDFVIISGGVNIYPQEVENVLAEHPKVADAAVFGVPNEEYGQEVKAVVQLVEGSEAGPEVAAEIVAFCRERLAHYKCPRSIEFAQQLPRTPTGKLAKHELLKRTLTPSQ